MKFSQTRSTHSVRAPFSKAKPVLLFVACAYGLAWLIWLPVLLGPDGLGITHYEASIPLFISVGTLGPLLAGLIADWYATGAWQLPSRLLPSTRPGAWLNLLTGPLLVIIAFVVIPRTLCVMPGHMLASLSFLTPLLNIWPNILGGPLEEELGWRGYLLPRLADNLGSIRATLLVALIWAIWHLPLLLCHVWRGLSFWYYLPLVMALSFFMSLSYFATGGSIVGPVLVHYVFNQGSIILSGSMEGEPRVLTFTVDDIVLASMIGMALLILAVTRGRLARSSPPDLSARPVSRAKMKS